MKKRTNISVKYCHLWDRISGESIFTRLIRSEVEGNILSDWESCDDVTDSRKGIVYYRNARSIQLNRLGNVEFYKKLKVDYYNGIIHSKAGKIKLRAKFKIDCYNLVFPIY